MRVIVSIARGLLFLVFFCKYIMKRKEPQQDQGGANHANGMEPSLLPRNVPLEAVEPDQLLKTFPDDDDIACGFACSGDSNSVSRMPLHTNSILNEIMTALKQPNFFILGMYGSSNASNVVAKLSNRVRLEGVFVVVEASVTKKPNLETIQKDLGKALGLELHEKTTLKERASRLCDKIKKEEKILIILNDLHGEINLGKIGIPFGNEHRGCKILLVAENQKVLSDKMKTQKEYSADGSLSSA